MKVILLMLLVAGAAVCSIAPDSWDQWRADSRIAREEARRARYHAREEVRRATREAAWLVAAPLGTHARRDGYRDRSPSDQPNARSGAPHPLPLTPPRPRPTRHRADRAAGRAVSGL